MKIENVASSNTRGRRCIFGSACFSLENAARNPLMKLYLFQKKQTSNQQQTIHHQLRQKDRHYQNSSHLKSSKSAPFHKFVLTGGLCGGKTTAHARLSSCEHGFEVITVPEAFTILASNGFQPIFFAADGIAFCVQNSVMDMQSASLARQR